MKYLIIILTCLAFESLGDIIYSREQNISPYGGYSLDLNSDSLVDVYLNYEAIVNHSETDSSIYGDLSATMEGFNGVVVVPSENYTAGVPHNTSISGTLDPSLEWKEGESVLLPGGEYLVKAIGYVSNWGRPDGGIPWDWSGLLGETGSAYIGVSIDEMDGSHYGWINIALDPESLGGLGGGSPIITGWAYESDPNTAIMAGAIPEPSSGILTMIGTLSLLQLARSRRRSKQGCTPMPRCRSPQVRCGFSAERRVAQVSYGNADRISALRSRRRIQMESAAPEKW